MGAIKMTPLKKGDSLTSRIGHQNRHFLTSHGIGEVFLHKPVADWENIPAFQKFSSERAVKKT